VTVAGDSVTGDSVDTAAEMAGARMTASAGDSHQACHPALKPPSDPQVLPRQACPSVISTLAASRGVGLPAPLVKDVRRWEDYMRIFRPLSTKGRDG